MAKVTEELLKMTENEVINLIKQADSSRSTFNCKLSDGISITILKTIVNEFMVPIKNEITKIRIFDFKKRKTVFNIPEDCIYNEGYLMLLIQTKFPLLWKAYKKNRCFLVPTEQDKSLIEYIRGKTVVREMPGN